MKTRVEEKFSDFYEKWICKLEELLQLLLGASSHRETEAEHCVSLVNKLTTHHKEYYTIKWAAAHEDVLAFFAPVWLSSLEIACLWVTGWKPSMAFKLVDSLRHQQQGHNNPSEEQMKKMEALRLKIKSEEERVEREMERQQVAMADPKMVELAKLVSRASSSSKSLIDKEAVTKIDGLVEGAMKNVMAGLERVMKMADCVRLKTLKGVLDILSPQQSVFFLAAVSMVLIRMRKQGKIREDQLLQLGISF